MPTMHRAIALSVTTLALLIMLALMLVAAVPATATPLSTKKAKLEAVQAELAEVYQRSDVAVEAYHQATAELQDVQGKVKQNRRKLAAAQRELALANERLSARARDIYMAPEVSVIDIVVVSASFDQLVAQFDSLRRVGQSDADLVAEAEARRREVERRRVELAEQEQAATRIVAQRRETKEQVLALQAQLESTAGSLKDDIAEIEAAQAAAAARAAQRAQAAQTSSAAGTSGGSSTGGSSSGGGSANGGGAAGHPAVATIVKRYLGVPYVWGGASPSGFDCSGLTMYCYAQVGVSLAHGATLQQKASHPVSLGNLQPGDLVFFGSASFSSHVGVYVGGGQMIHAPHTGAVVSYGSISGAWIGGRF